MPTFGTNFILSFIPYVKAAIFITIAFVIFATITLYRVRFGGDNMSANDAAVQGRAIITVLGSDRSGIVAAVAGALATCDANILDISQTILQGIFTMTMLVDLGSATVPFADLQTQLNALSEELGVQISMQREEVFNFMYRL